jgi:hypothetical protein
MKRLINIIIFISGFLVFVGMGLLYVFADKIAGGFI